MKALARLALALVAVLSISACVVEPLHDGGGHGDRDYHYR
jgi:hypothetical protein